MVGSPDSEALQEDKFQRATLKADLRAREDELEAAKLRAGDLEREVADLKVGHFVLLCAAPCQG